MQRALGSTESAWHRLANCKGLPSRAFFGQEPEDTDAPAKPMSRTELAAAKSVCRNCAVRRQCLVYSLEGDEQWGVWGGYNRPERERMVAEWGYDTPVDLREPGEKPSAERALPFIMLGYDAGYLDAVVVRLS